MNKQTNKNYKETIKWTTKHTNEQKHMNKEPNILTYQEKEVDKPRT